MPRSARPDDSRGRVSAIGLDVGTGSLKGIALAEDGTVQAMGESSYAFETPRPGWSEQDPELW